MAAPARRSALVATALAAVAACVPAPAPPIDHAGFEDVRRVVAALDDVRGEYQLAVDEAGGVVDPVRLRLLADLMHGAEVFAQRFPDDERAALHELAAALGARAAPAAVVTTAAALRHRTLARRRLVLAPGAPPPRARGQEMWRLQCAGCHGATGVGDGWQGLSLDPEPKNFHDPEIMAALTPSRACSRIIDGMPGTAMPSWGLLSAAERWALAFLVLSFQHDETTVARGREAALRHRVVVSPTWLADRSDPELVADLRRRGLDAGAAADVVAFARAEAAFAPIGGALAGVRGALADGVVRYHDRRFDEAIARFALARRRLAGDLETIRLGDPALAAGLELQLQRVTAAAAAGALAEVVEREVVSAHVLLDRAEDRLRRPPLAGAVRLGLERAGAAALALGLLLVRRRRAVVTVVMAALLALAAGELILRLPVRPAAVALATLALTVAIGAALAAARSMRGLAVAAVVVAAAAAAGRAGWLLGLGRDAPWLHLPRIEALGLYPSSYAIAAAAAAALVTAAALALLPRGTQRASASGQQ